MPVLLPVIDVPLLRFGSDVSLRKKLFARSSFAHPAKLHLGLLEWIVNRYTCPGDTICDPMAGVGSILLAATLERNVIAREIEPKWLAMLHENAARIISTNLWAGKIDVGQADAREAWGVKANAVIFSPPYGNDFTARSPEAKKGYQKHGTIQTFVYGQHEAQLGHLWGKKYWDAMRQVYKQAHEALLPGGVMVVVIKDHIRGGERVHTSAQTVEMCEWLGFRLVGAHARLVDPLSFWQERRKKKGLLVVEEEDVLAFVRRRT